MSRSHSFGIWANLLMGTLMCLSYQPVWAQNLTDRVDEFLRSRIEVAGVPPKIWVGEEIIYSSFALPLFYERRAYRPAWSDDAGSLMLIDDLIGAISRAEQEGLRPADYHLAKLQTILSKLRQNQQKGLPPDPRRLADLDLLATDAFLILGSHYLAGRINPETIDPEWIANRREAHLEDILQKALDSQGIAAALEELLPQQPGYARLREALRHYRDLAAPGGWPAVPEGAKLQKGDRNPRVSALRTRLRAEGVLSEDPAGALDLFDDNLDGAVRHFQRRHGLDVDGIVGRATLAALNVSALERSYQIEVNLERWRWLPESLGKRHIIVNIAGFELDVIESGHSALAMRVVVGRDYRRTPVFSDKITYVVLNPHWEVPLNIAIQDKIPLILKDPEYLSKEKMKVLQGWGAETREIAPETIDWSRVTEKNFAYRLRQDPGPLNALGRVKFMFPNKFNVYLHDTPSRELFARSERTFSSGCIRVEKPMQLAEYLLRGDPNWTGEKILAAINKGIEQTIRLPEPTPIHLLYSTAWVSQDGVINFRRDIYGRDKLLADALREEPPDSD